jgi:hypothetical protein
MVNLFRIFVNIRRFLAIRDDLTIHIEQLLLMYILQQAAIFLGVAAHHIPFFGTNIPAAVRIPAFAGNLWAYYVHKKES